MARYGSSVCLHFVRETRSQTLIGWLVRASLWWLKVGSKLMKLLNKFNYSIIGLLMKIWSSDKFLFIMTDFLAKRRYPTRSNLLNISGHHSKSGKTWYDYWLMKDISPNWYGWQLAMTTPIWRLSLSMVLPLRKLIFVDCGRSATVNNPQK